MRDYSPYQKKIISRFYDQRDQIDEQRLSELVTNLYLAKPGSKQLEKLWASAEEAMQRLKVPEKRIAHIMQSRDPAVLAEVVKDIQSGKISK